MEVEGRCLRAAAEGIGNNMRRSGHFRKCQRKFHDGCFCSLSGNIFYHIPVWDMGLFGLLLPFGATLPFARNLPVMLGENNMILLGTETFLLTFFFLISFLYGCGCSFFALTKPNSQFCSISMWAIKTCNASNISYLLSKKKKP